MPRPRYVLGGAALGLILLGALVDYATIHKGTRATRQIEVTNNSSAAVSFSVSRSQCKCLYYEYKDTVAAKAKETVTVTVDGARAKAGTLQETLELNGKKAQQLVDTVPVRYLIAETAPQILGLGAYYRFTSALLRENPTNWNLVWRSSNDSMAIYERSTLRHAARAPK